MFRPPSHNQNLLNRLDNPSHRSNLDILDICYNQYQIYLICSGGSNYGLGAGTFLPADLDKLVYIDNNKLSQITKCYKHKLKHLRKSAGRKVLAPRP